MIMDRYDDFNYSIGKYTNTNLDNIEKHTIN